MEASRMSETPDGVLNTENFDGPPPFVRPLNSEASMFIQWKGTDVCVDFICACGTQGHFDGYFAHYLRCPTCGAVYQMGTQVIVRRISDEEAAVAGSIQTLDIDDDVPS